MNKQSLDSLPSLNLSAFCELTPCQQRARASPTNLSICFSRLFYLLACESYCSCVLPSCGVLGLGIFKDIFALFACWTQTHTKHRVLPSLHEPEMQPLLTSHPFLCANPGQTSWQENQEAFPSFPWAGSSPFHTPVWFLSQHLLHPITTGCIMGLRALS